MPGDGAEGGGEIGGSDRAVRSESAVRSEPGVRTFSWEELSKLNEPHNAHVAVRGKVRPVTTYTPCTSRLRTFTRCTM